MIARDIALAAVTGALAAALGATFVSGAPATDDAVLAPPLAHMQRIVVVRHGEKPAAGLGQLNCRGLARSLALPDVIRAKFGAAQMLFAPNPARRKPDRGHLYAYIRPLATIEPLAIRLGLPVDLRFGFDDAMGLAHLLIKPHLAADLIVVAWEHKLAVPLVREVLKRTGADPRQVEAWKDDDFDRMDVIEIQRTPGQPPTTTYRRDSEGLDGIPGDCPGAHPHP